VPFGGNDWLALRQEPVLEPELPICDPHHHFWDFRTSRIPYQRYLLHELAEDIGSGHNVRSTVFVEARAMYRAAGPEEMRPVGEVEFVQGLAAASASGLCGPGRAAAIVGHANLNLGERVAPVLEALRAASPNRFRGIRHSVTWDPHPEVENTAAHPIKGQLASAEFRAGARVLARIGLSFDAWLYFPQLPELAAFAQAVPDLPIVLNHIGGLLRTGPYADRDPEVLDTWRRGIAAVAACPNMHVKLGGIGMPRTLRLAHARRAHRLGGAGRLDPALHGVLHRAVRPEPRHVREQFPGGQGVVFVPRHVQRLQAPLEGLFGRRARRDVP
jgi:predicted TIM-barrel fold metal-dependent hydrolase